MRLLSIIEMRLFFLLLIFISCKGQNRSSQDRQKTKKDTIMRTFDIERFNKNQQHSRYFFTTSDNVEVKQYAGDIEYWETVKHKDSILEQYYEYFHNGKLKCSVKSFPKSFRLGYLKEYDIDGNLVKQTNLDEPFTYRWEDVEEYLKKHKVYDLQQQDIDISRWSDEKCALWILNFKGEYNKVSGEYLIVLDGKTGKELEVRIFKGKGPLGEDGTIGLQETIYKDPDYISPWDEEDE